MEHLVLTHLRHQAELEPSLLETLEKQSKRDNRASYLSSGANSHLLSFVSACSLLIFFGSRSQKGQEGTWRGEKEGGRDGGAGSALQQGACEQQECDRSCSSSAGSQENQEQGLV